MKNNITPTHEKNTKGIFVKRKKSKIRKKKSKLVL